MPQSQQTWQALAEQDVRLLYMFGGKLLLSLLQVLLLISSDIT